MHEETIFNMEEITETTPETCDYKDMKRMLESSDQENRVMALQCLENLDFESNWMIILLLLKHANVPKSEWRSNAPKLTDTLKKRGISMEKVTTYQEVLNFTSKVKASDEQLQFFIEDVNETLRKNLADIGYDHIAEIQVTLKEKEND